MMIADVMVLMLYQQIITLVMRERNTLWVCLSATEFLLTWILEVCTMRKCSRTMMR